MSLYLGDIPIANDGSHRLTGEIGDMGFAPLGIDETLNLRRYLNGQVISQSLSPSFTTKVKQAIALFPNLGTTESNWQSEKTLSKLGQCGKFVVDDTEGTIRLPAIVNAQGLLSLSAIGTIKDESLPNITGEFRVYSNNSDPNVENASGAFGFNTKTSQSSKYINASPATSTFQPRYIDFDASRSSSSYQTDAPVQQEAIQYPYYIQVATGVEETLPAIREYEINTPFFFGQSMYSENAPYNASWLASNGSYNASTLYPDFWTQLTGVELNGSLNVGDTIEIGGKTYVKRGLPVVLSTDTITDYDFVVNQNDQTFRLPLLNGERVLVKKYVNGSDWYNLYSDGWLEQGGYLSSVPSGTTGSAVTFLKPFSNTDYFSLPSWGAVVYAAFGISRRTTSGMTVYNRSNETTYCFWKACGYAPIPTQVDFTEVAGLYYYVGDTVQDASLINAGAVLGQLSNKADVDLSNLSTIGMNTIYNTSTVVYDTVTDVTASVFAASGTGYKPSKRGVLMIKTRDSVNKSYFWIYNATGTVIFNRLFNSSEGSMDVSGGTATLPLTPDFSIRVGTQAGTAGSDYWAVFYPYKA